MGCYETVETPELPRVTEQIGSRLTFEFRFITFWVFKSQRETECFFIIKCVETNACFGEFVNNCQVAARSLRHMYYKRQVGREEWKEGVYRIRSTVVGEGLHFQSFSMPSSKMEG